MPNKDFNLIVAKISLLLLTYLLYFNINGFFFSDKTMNKIKKDKGEFNLFFQILQTLYSTIISAIINMLLKRLFYLKNKYYLIKQEIDFKKIEKKLKKINY